MAGLYPDAPSRRMAWDADGSIGLGRDRAGNFINKEWSAANMAELNDENNVNVDDASLTGESLNTGTSLYLIFPELREVDGVFLSGQQSAGTNNEIRISGNTTNTFDGTWSVELAAAQSFSTCFPDNYRDNILSTAASNVRGIHWMDKNNNSGGYFAWHVYGEISPGETPDKIIVIDEGTGLEFTKPVDFAEVPRGSSEDFQIRLRNDSASQTATTVQYTAEDLEYGSGSWYTFTLPGGATFQATQQIASIAAATTTGIITGRRITVGTESAHLHAARLKVNTASWS